MSTFDILRNPRLIAANTLVGLSFAALQGCGVVGDMSPDTRIDNSYSQDFIDKDGTVCFPDEVVDHPAIQTDLIAALKTNEKLAIDQLHGAYSSAGNINTILSAKHEKNGDPTDKYGYNPVRLGDTYEYCVNEETGEIQPGNPDNFAIITARD